MPRLLDLFCGAGGSAVGYHRAGFDEIVGVDNRPMPRYPFHFVSADALEYVRQHGHEFDAIHASPPCQAYSIMRNLPWLRHKNYPMLIQPTAGALEEIGKPWVIENVMGAKLASGWLCGTMFGKAFYRHRFFWCGGWFWLQPSHPIHRQIVRPSRQLGSRARDVVFTRARRGKEVSMRLNGAQRLGVNGGHAAGVQAVRDEMELPWMNRKELTNAVPPVYTEFIGRQLIQAIRNGCALPWEPPEGKRPA